MAHLFLRNIENYGVVSDHDKEALQGAIGRIKDYAPDEDIVKDGQNITESCAVLEGFACRYKVLSDGRRQIMAFHIPGDLPDLHGFLLSMDHSLGTLTACKIAFIPHQALREITETRPHVARALWRITLVDGAIFREWMVGLGRRTAYERIAHVLCEVLLRLKAVGLAEEYTYELPVTQAELADALGLSVVHVNRVLQQLRREGVITLKRRTLAINDWERLQAIAQFDPSYLHVGEKGKQSA
jgi:CRP-like cAMP-binding protein